MPRRYACSPPTRPGSAQAVKQSRLARCERMTDRSPRLGACSAGAESGGGRLLESERTHHFGETGTGKTHLATGLAVEACRQRKPVRFTTAAQLVNELTEAKDKSELNRVTNRWTRYELIVIDEMAYVAMPEAAAELLFQIIAGRAERAAVMVTTKSAVLRVDHHDGSTSVKHWTRSTGRGVSPTFLRDALCRPADPPPFVPVLDGSSRSLALA
jgi:hypothetical protein